MNIFVKSTSEKIHQFKIESTNITVKELKKILTSKQVISHEEVCIYFEKKILKDNQLLSSYEISQDSILTWFINKQIQISLISTAFKQVIQIDALLSNTIQDIIKSIQNESNKLAKKKDQKFQLVYNGNQLKQQKHDTLFDLGIKTNIIIHLVPIIDSSKKSDNLLILVNPVEIEKKKKKNRCEYKSCTDKVVQVIGACTYCQLKYCSRHRLPEAHACVNLTGCKQLAHERNSIKLLSERCVANKI